MLQIKGISDNACFLTGKTEGVVDVKFKDGSFTGSIEWNELFNILKRRSAGEKNSADDKTSR